MKITDLTINLNLNQSEVDGIEDCTISNLGGDIFIANDLNNGAVFLKKTGSVFRVFETYFFNDIEVIDKKRHVCHGDENDLKIPLTEILVGDVFTDSSSVAETDIKVIGEKIVLFSDITRKTALVAFDLGNGWELAGKKIPLL